MSVPRHRTQFGRVIPYEGEQSTISDKRSTSTRTVPYRDNQLPTERGGTPDGVRNKK